MIVDENEAVAAFPDGAAENLAGMDQAAVDQPLGHQMLGDQMVFRVKQENPEFLLGHQADTVAEESHDILGTGNAGALAPLRLFTQAAGQREGRLELHRLDLAKPGDGGKLADFGRGQPHQAVVVRLQQPFRQAQRRTTLAPGAQQNRQQFAVLERFRPQPGQPLARPFLIRHLRHHQAAGWQTHSPRCFGHFPHPRGSLDFGLGCWFFRLLGC